MAYPSGDIDTTIPTDANLLEEGQARIRETRRYLLERLTSIFVDPDADPLVLQDGTVATSIIADLAVTAAKIALATITTAQLADAAVTGAKIADTTITEDNMGAGSVGTAELIDLSVTNAKIIGLDGSKLVDGSVATAAIAAAAITTGLIVAQAITTALIADLNVTTGKLADGAVTTAKITDGAVTAAKLDAGVTGDQLEMREVDFAFAGATLVHDTTINSTVQTFTGVVAGDNLGIGIPQAHFSEAAPLLSFQAVAYADGFRFIVQNLSGGPIGIPACTFKVYCIKKSSDW